MSSVIRNIMRRERGKNTVYPLRESSSLSGYIFQNHFRKGLMIMREGNISEKKQLRQDDIERIQAEYRQIYEKALVRKGEESTLSILPYLLPMAGLYFIAMITHSSLYFESVMAFTLIFGASVQSTLILLSLKKCGSYNRRDVLITILVLLIGTMMMFVKSL